jgi:hypothetical protein
LLTDSDAEKRDRHLVKRALQAGLGASVALLAVGFVLAMSEREAPAVGVRLHDLFEPMAPATRVSALGVLLLALTPTMRVVLLLVLWARERDFRFAAIAGVVFVILVGAVFAGAG